MKKIELPIIDPKLSTFHGQVALCGILANNMSIWNWVLNESTLLRCELDFLFGYGSPKIGIRKTSVLECPHINRCEYSMKYLKGYTGHILRNLMDDGLYVFFNGIDDYYMQGKTWYGERHFNHDGLICGYDMETKTYSVFAYDKNWRLRKFNVPMKCFDAGRESMFKQGICGSIFGLSPQEDEIMFSPEIACESLKEYLDSGVEQYSSAEKGTVYGIAVHDYIIKYLDMHIEGSIPYEKLDRRVFRLIWEHKKVMLERLIKMEEVLGLDSETSRAYAKIVSDADTMRMLYASHHMKRRDTLLPMIKRKLIAVNESERQLLADFIKKTERKITNDTLESN